MYVEQNDQFQDLKYLKIEKVELIKKKLKVRNSSINKIRKTEIFILLKFSQFTDRQIFFVLELMLKELFYAPRINAVVCVIALLTF